MLTSNFNLDVNHSSLSFLGKEAYENSDCAIMNKTIYSNSETLSNHISESVLKTLKEQLSNRGRGVELYSDAKEELQSLN